MTDHLFKEQENALRPSQLAGLTHALCAAMADIVECEGGERMTRRAYLKLYGLAMAAEQSSRVSARWFGNLSPEAEELLERLEAKR